MRQANRRRGFSLFDVMVTLTVIGVLLAMTVPTFERGVEQARADVAAANLRAIWAAERLFWLENGRYTANFAELGDLLDPSVAASATFYSYAVASPDGTTCSAKATRIGSSKWTGQFTIDQTGAVSGTLTAAGQAKIVPAFQ